MKKTQDVILQNVENNVEFGQEFNIRQQKTEGRRKTVESGQYGHCPLDRKQANSRQ